MVSYLYGPLPAVDGATGAPVPNATGQIFAIDDPSLSTPLTVTDLAGVATTTVRSTPNSLVTAFRIDDRPEGVIWVSGTYRVPLVTVQGLIDAAIAAVAEAADAAAAAEAAAADASTAAAAAAAAAGSGTGGTGTGGVTAHAALTGLSNDDHPQYLNTSRGDGRYHPRAEAIAAINTAIATSSAADRTRSNHGGTQAMSTIEGLVARLTVTPQWVVVNTGNEARPAGSNFVIWDARAGVDPVAAEIQDIVITPTTVTSLPGDSTAPTVPSGVTISGETATQFTVSWTASADSVGVTGYEVFVDGVAVAGISSSLSKIITGRTASTTYQVRVRARDAAGNWSAQSVAVPATTAASGGGGGGTPQHSVWGTADPAVTKPGLVVTKFTDAGGTIEMGHGFYRYGSGAGFYPNMRIVGGKIWKPAGVTLPAQVTVRLYQVNTSTLPNASIGTLLETKTVSPSWVDGWNTVLFDTPEPVSAVICYAVTISFGGANALDDDTYLHSQGLPLSGPMFATDGTKLVLSESATPGGYLQSFFKIGAGVWSAPTTPGGATGNIWYAVDIVVDEG